MVNITVSQFFNRAAVLKKVKDGTQSVMSKAGAFVRQRSRTSIRKRKRSATAGSPPSSHLGWLRDRIFFGYDARSDSVVVGPTLKARRSPTIPELLEHGGKSVTSKGLPSLYAKHPYMAPALDAEHEKFAGLFSGAIR